MKTLSVPPIDAQVESKIVRLIRSAASLETIIFAMRDSGLNKIESIKMLRDHAGVSLAEGKNAVHLSKAWQDVRESDELLHEEAIAAAGILGFTEELQ